MKIGSLFSGYGGLDLAVESFFHAETVWHAEWEDAPSKVLSHHWPGVPNFRDVTQVDWESVEPVDIITGGFPCQDVSMAGKRAGMVEGTRSNLWGAMRTAIETIRPRFVVAENVRGLLSATAQSDSDLEQRPGFMGDGSNVTLRALGRVLGDLADIGYDAQWCGLRAADIGAPHNRFRVFILATNTSRRTRRIAEVEHKRIQRLRADTLQTPADDVQLLPTPVTRDSRSKTIPRKSGSKFDPGTVLADIAYENTWNQYSAAIRQWEHLLGRVAPTPTAVSAKGKHQLSPVFVEWMMGLNPGHVTSIDGISRANQLKMLGNGVVPQQAYEALRRMKEAE